MPGLGSALCSEGACRLAPVETACQLDLARTGLAASEDGATAGGGSEAPSSVALWTPLPEQKRLGTHPLCALWVHLVHSDFHWAPWPSAEPSATPEAPRHRGSQARLQVVEPAPCSLHGPAPPESLSPPDPICKVRD